MTATTDKLGSTPVVSSPPPRPPAARRARLVGLELPAVLYSARTRILFWYVVLLVAALLFCILAIRQALISRLDAEIDRALTQEVSELRTLATAGVDPETGEPFASVARVLEVFLSRTVPDEGESMLSYVDGRLHRLSQPVGPMRLDQLEGMNERLGSVDEPELGMVETPLGQVHYAAVPLRPADAEAVTGSGVFVVAEFRDLQLAEVDAVVQIAAGVGAATLLLASLLGWFAASRALAPVRLLTDTARLISESDLSRRIPVQGRDEISRLAETFNGMLGRLEAGFATQRTFIHDAGHELRTPITIVRGHLELLGDDPQEKAETVALVTDELDRMSRIVDDLLLLAKAEQPDFVKLAPVELGPLTDDLAAKAMALGNRRWGVEERATDTILADRQRLTQAVMQLCQNAVQHTRPEDSITLGCAVEHGCARLWVRDTGPGIAPEDQEHIFTRFGRAQMGRRRSDGAGLGLAIVRAICEGHGGHVELDSAPGCGSLFTIVVPSVAPDIVGSPAALTAGGDEG